MASKENTPRRISERLMEKDELYKKRKEMKRKEQAREELRECSFQPNVHKREGWRKEMGVRHELLYSDGKRKQKRKSKARDRTRDSIEYEQQKEEMTFKPKTNHKPPP